MKALTARPNWRRRLGARDKVDNLQRMLNGQAVKSVLEVGCGTGSVLAEVVRRGISTRHVGVDVADPSAHMDPGATGLDLRAYDGITLPFPDGSFDLVVASHVVEHVPNPRHFLAELARVASKLVYVEVPCEQRARFSHATVQSALNTGHINAYSPEYFLVLLQTTGLDVVDLQLFDHSLAVHSYGKTVLEGRARMGLRRALLRVNPILASRVFCYHCGAPVRPTARRNGSPASS